MAPVARECVHPIRTALALTAVIAGIYSAAAAPGAATDIWRSPSFDAGPPGPTVWVLGDSLSDDWNYGDSTEVMKPMMAQEFARRGWHVHVEATAGWRIADQLAAGVFAEARAAGPAVILVQLGTNDLMEIEGMDGWHRTAADARYAAALLAAVHACVIWEGLNERAGRQPLARYARRFDDQLRRLDRRYPDVAYAGYTEFVRGNRTYADGLGRDGIHPWPDASKRELVRWRAREIARACGARLRGVTLPAATPPATLPPLGR